MTANERPTHEPYDMLNGWRRMLMSDPHSLWQSLRDGSGRLEFRFNPSLGEAAESAAVATVIAGEPHNLGGGGGVLRDTRLLLPRQVNDDSQTSASAAGTCP